MTAEELVNTDEADLSRPDADFMDVVRLSIGQASQSVGEALIEFNDDMGGAPTIGAWKRQRSS